MTPPPIVLALVICDAVHRDPTSGKSFVLGTFAGFESSAFPTTRSVTAYVVVTAGRGVARIRVRLVDAEGARSPIAEAEASIEFSDPRDVAEFAVYLDAEFPEAGEYRLQLFADDEFLVERRLRVQERENEE